MNTNSALSAVDSGIHHLNNWGLTDVLRFSESMWITFFDNMEINTSKLHAANSSSKDIGVGTRLF